MDVKFRPMDTRRDWDWMHERAKPLYTSNTKGLVAFDADTDRILAMAVFDNWTETAVQMHMSIEVPIVLRRGFFYAAFNFSFWSFTFLMA